MEPLTWVFGVLALAAIGVAAWLTVGRGRLVREHASVAARAEQAALRVDEIVQESAAAAERFRNEIAVERGRAEESGTRVLELSQQLSQLRERLENVEVIKQELEKNETRLRETFKALSGEALKESRAEFLQQAKPVFDAAKKEQSDLVKPIGEVLGQTRDKLAEIEKLRVESFARLQEKIETVTGSSDGLRAETARLTKALSRPEIRGQYGEVQLRRVAELAGMTSYCDFDEQSSTRDSEGGLLRPDMVVRLPNERIIAVDAKTNTYAYLEAVNAQDDKEREEHLTRFARHVLDQAKKLGAKKYWAQYEGSPDFVVMFVPGDHFIDAALARQPDLIGFAAEHNVVLASPSTLIGLLRAVAVGWREHSLTEHAAELSLLGKELHERAAVAFAKINELGQLIGKSSRKFDEVVGSIDARLVPTLRKFEAADAKSAKEIVELKMSEEPKRRLTSGLDE